MKENMIIAKWAIDFFKQLTDEQIAIYEATFLEDKQ